jgi:prostaglandin-endoperoxide synthase 2
MRDTSRDGLRNQIETRILTSGEPIWRATQRLKPVRRWLNRFLINNAILKAKTRPYPFSTRHDYTTWDSLTDRTYSSRHLAPRYLPQEFRPTPEEAAGLFRRGTETRLCPKSTVLFAFFAQWFTDGFLRTDRTDRRRNTSNHEIDLCQLYGLKPAETNAVRAMRGGLLKSQHLGGEEYPEFLHEKAPDGTLRQKEEFRDLRPLHMEAASDADKEMMFAFASDRANVQLAYIALTTLFLREHNRLARMLSTAYASWDDERLFQTARNILIVLLINIVIDEYINHIAPYYFKFAADPTAFKNEAWYRTNWMTVEFNLLYRWHSLVPSTFQFHGKQLTIQETEWNTDVVLERGLGSMLEQASEQRAGEVGLFNTHEYLIKAEQASIELNRHVGLQSYNDYRECVSFPRLTSFRQISGDRRVQRELEELYGHIDHVDYYVGLFAEDRRHNSVLPGLLGRFVGIDAFSQALTNPLLAPNVFNARTFSPLGLEVIKQTHTLKDIVRRNVPDGQQHFISMTRRGWARSTAASTASRLSASRTT